MEKINLKELQFEDEKNIDILGKYFIRELVEAGIFVNGSSTNGIELNSDFEKILSLSGIECEIQDEYGILTQNNLSFLLDVNEIDGKCLLDFQTLKSLEKEYKKNAESL